MPYSFLNKAEEINSLGFEKYTQILLVTDSNVAVHCYPLIKDFLPKHELFNIEAGESHKDLTHLQSIWDQALAMNLGRSDLMIALGGGMVSDLLGFAASSYKRGVSCIYLPTSLMAMVDAAHGGKTGINYGGIKNSIGAFSNPQHIYIHLPFLNTLEPKDIKSGFAEIIKHGIIEGGELWAEIKNIEVINSSSFSEAFVIRIIEVKQKTVALDFTESGKRKILNHGHSLGHAIESLFLESGKAITHGHAVALGMLLESFIAHAHFYLSDEHLNEITYCITKHYPLISIDFSLTEIMDKLWNDKKNLNLLSFSLPLEIGHVQQDCEVSESQVKESLELYARFCS